MSAYRERLVPLVRKWARTRQRVVIFGVGPHTDLLLSEVPELLAPLLVAFVDNNAQHHGTRHRGRLVHPPTWADDHADVILCSSFVHEAAMARSVESLNCKVVMSHEPGSVVPPSPPVAQEPSHAPPSSGTAPAAAEPAALDLRSSAPSPTPDIVPGRFDVVVLPIIDWHFRFQRPQQLAAQLAARGHRVFYVRNVMTAAGTEPSVRVLRDRVFEVTLSSHRPLNIYADALDEEGRAHLLADMTWVAARFGLADVVCVVDLPFWGPLASALHASHGWRVVYDCMDEHAGFTGVSSHMLAGEEQLLAAADLVLASSRPLFERLVERHPRVELIPNGAEYAHFARPLAKAPAALDACRRPIVGYYGAVAEWFDSQLVAEVATRRPDWSFVIIGDTAGGDVTPLERVGNVHLWPEQKYRDLPPILDRFDVAIIPFKRTALTDATNPVKLYEYSAAGKPVVATRLSELERLSSHVALATGADEWESAIARALECAAPNEVAERRAMARANTWATRAAALEASCDTLFPLVSVLVVTYNGLDVNTLCLESVLGRTRYPHIEVVVVDNASTDGTPAYLTERAARDPRLKVSLRRENLGFARANNLAASLASGRVLVFLNNDTIVPPECLSRLVAHLDDPSVGLVGPLTNWSGNETRIDVPYRGLDEIEAFSHAHTSTRLGRRFDIAMLAFFCVAMRRDDYDRLGPLDERFGVGMFEDDDYARRVRAAGLTCVCAEDAFVHHWGRASFGALDQSFYDALFAQNRAYFESKWGKWEAHRARSTAALEIAG